MRTLLLALALVAAPGCTSNHTVDHSADFAARRQLRARALEAQLQVIATQPMLINTIAQVFPLTEAGRARVTEKLVALQMRFDEAKNQIGLVRTSLPDQLEAADAKATDAMKKLDDARKDAWDALDKAPRTDRSS
jgi:hypothetical protein